MLLALSACLADGSVQADEQHLPVGRQKSQVQGAVEVPLLPRRPVNPRNSSHLIMEDERPLREFDHDRSLTELCRAGRFRQKRDRFLMVRLDGYIYGAVVGGHWALYDPEGMAVPDLIYVLKRQDTARCEVFVIKHLAPPQ